MMETTYPYCPHGADPYKPTLLYTSLRSHIVVGCVDPREVTANGRALLNDPLQRSRIEAAAARFGRRVAMVDANLLSFDVNVLASG